MRSLDEVEVAKIWIRGGNLDKIPKSISLFDRGKEICLGISLRGQNQDVQLSPEKIEKSSNDVES